MTTEIESPQRGTASPLALVALFLVWGLHCAVNLAIFKEAEVPPYYDAANHVNIALEIRDHYDRFEPGLGWFDRLYDLSSYYPPCHHLFAALCLKVRQHTLDSARLPNLFFLGLLMLSVYLWGTRLFSSGVGLLAGVLVSLYPVVHGLSREIYVDLALLSWTAAAAFLVWESDGFRRWGIAFLFGVVCGFGLLTKWTFPVFIGLPVLWALAVAFLPNRFGGSPTSRPNFAASFIGMAVAAAPALLIAGPWYIKHFAFVSYEGTRVLTEAAQVRGMAEVWTLESMLYYFLTLESHQLRLPFWLLAIAALGGAFGRKGWNRSTWLLVGTFALSYITMTSLWVKDPRYFTPAIYPLPILTAAWLLSFEGRIRKVGVGAVLAIGLIGYLNQVFGLPLLSRKIEIPTPFGQPLVLTGPAPYGDMLRYDGDWPHRQMVEGIQLHRDHASHLPGRLEIPVLVDDGFLHAPALDCYARMLGADLRFFNIAYRPDYRSDPGSMKRLLNVLRAPYFITKEDGDLGLEFVAKAYRPLLERLFAEGSGWGGGVKPLAVFHLPFGGTATVWKNQFPAANLGERNPLDAKFSNGVRLTGFRISKSNLLKRGAAALLRVDWVPEPKERLPDLLEGHEFFLHLEDARDGRFIQGWNFPLSDERPEIALSQIDSGSPAAVLSTLLIQPREDLLSGIYRLRLGVFKPETGDKVALADPVAEIQTSIPLGESFEFEADGWELTQAEFEDRAALEVRDEIGWLMLESARFTPRSARPGETVELECVWAYEWLELEAEEERDVRAFAYLLPASATGVFEPKGRVGWVLDAAGQGGPGLKRWTTKTRMPLPSDLGEGGWRVCVGVERPRYEREFIIRSGAQSGRNSYALTELLWIGFSDWESIGAEFPAGLRLHSARILESSPTVGANLRFEASWSAASARALLEAASQEFLFIHLFSEADEEYTQLESFPLFRRDRILHGNKTVGEREGEAFFEGIRSGFSERYPFRLKEDLPPGPHRVEFGLFNPSTNERTTAGLPSGATVTTLILNRPITIRGLGG